MPAQSQGGFSCFSLFSSKRVLPEQTGFEADPLLASSIEVAKSKIVSLEREKQVLAAQNAEMERLRCSNVALEEDLRKLSAKYRDLLEQTRSLPTTAISTDMPAQENPTIPPSEFAHPWTLSAEDALRLEELFACTADAERQRLLARETQISLGMGCEEKDALPRPAEGLESFKERICREWELAHKTSILLEMRIARKIAECIPGGNMEAPLAAVYAMSSGSLSHLCENVIAHKLEETFKKPPQQHVGRNSGLPVSNNTKFSLDEATPGLREASYGGIDEFYGGLVDRIGLPRVNLSKGLEEDHCRGEDADEEFATSNYNIKTTPRKEWCAVSDPMMQKELSVGTRTIRSIDELLQAPIAIKAKLLKEEILALQLYTGDFPTCVASG
eukprot:763888-Hanusia_phi.AAC.1